MNLVDLVLDVHRSLDRHDLPHAFGGALALAYFGEPRATVDIDVNVFVPVADLARVVVAMEEVACSPTVEPDAWVPVGGVRFAHRDRPFPVDVFPSIDEEVYGAIFERVAPKPFGPGDEELPFLSAEDLVLFKLSFGRDKDWVDLSAIARTGGDLDLDYIEAQLVALRGPTIYPRIARLRRLFASNMTE